MQHFCTVYLSQVGDESLIRLCLIVVQPDCQLITEKPGNGKTNRHTSLLWTDERVGEMARKKKNDAVGFG